MSCRIGIGCVLLLLSAAGNAHPPSAPDLSAATHALEYSNSIRSIDARDQDDSDLAAFKGAVGDARVVMLGETGHGSGAAMGAKARLAIFLHRKMGFDVIAYEASMFNSDWAERLVWEGADPRKAISNALPPMWWETEQTAPLLDEIVQSVHSDNPIEVVGIDPNFVVGGGDHARGRALESLSSEPGIDRQGYLG